MIPPLRVLARRLFGTRSDDTDDADETEEDEEPNDRIEGTRAPILDEVYGQPGVARETDRLEEAAREFEDGHP